MSVQGAVNGGGIVRSGGQRLRPALPCGPSGRSARPGLAAPPEAPGLLDTAAASGTQNDPLHTRAAQGPSITCKRP